MSAQTLMLVSAAIAATGKIIGGISEKKSAELNAFQIQTDKVLNDAQTMQAVQARREEHDLATSSNIAAFAAAGRDISQDRSVQAFLRRQEDIVGEDIGRLEVQRFLEGKKSSMAAMAERRRGRNALIASIFDAASTGASGYADAQAVKTPKKGK